MRYDVQAPEAGHNGEVAGVRFYRGSAVVDDSNRAALAYFRRRGYTVTPAEAGDAAEPEGPTKPAQGDNKAAWVAYIAATTDLSEAEAGDIKKDDLISLADEPTVSSEETDQ
ncbi:hypothetical protein F4561_002672 [Lipingzhangella halophila]|uniref:Uncharacterized protein n=1 Tax=Lipingzhangella halophila TaxID=1783352 RepID=A0A7W7RH98_9ACTN|nr:hypothetical protein [Lipingzhangella halophila]MBB4931852.1 hypothetical protein [Lipingzhangella halophila]